MNHESDQTGEGEEERYFVGLPFSRPPVGSFKVRRYSDQRSLRGFETTSSD
jgi:hypothetical protein